MSGEELTLGRLQPANSADKSSMLQASMPTVTTDRYLSFSMRSMVTSGTSMSRPELTRTGRA
jgi:hypothetical protein